MRERRPGAHPVLRERNRPAPLRVMASTHPPECLQPPAELARMGQFVAGLTDWRKRNPDFRLNRLVAVNLCAMLSQVCPVQRDLAAFAANLTVD